jgi:hypothetical protein
MHIQEACHNTFNAGQKLIGRFIGIIAGSVGALSSLDDFSRAASHVS